MDAARFTLRFDPVDSSQPTPVFFADKGNRPLDNPIHPTTPIRSSAFQQVHKPGGRDRQALDLPGRHRGFASWNNGSRPAASRPESQSGETQLPVEALWGYG